MIDNWIVALFYTLSNVWGSVVISLLFWSVANQYTSIQEAKKNYPLFGFIANSALVFTGLQVNYVSKYFYNNWNLNVQFLMFIASIFTFLLPLLIYIRSSPDPASINCSLVLLVSAPPLFPA